LKPIQILMPMGGLGQRFRDQGFTLPKPLIEIHGQPMFLNALSSFNSYVGEKKHLFVVRQDAEDEYRLATQIKQLLPDSQITMLQKNTHGATETCLLARKLIDPALPLIIMDCDFNFTSKEYFQKVTDLTQHGAYDGLLLSFESDWDRYSYALVDDKGMVVETAEKRVISSNALAGAYCFRSGSLFLETADKLLNQPISEQMREYYISYLYNILIEQDGRVALAKVDQFNSFGTPEELERFLDESRAN
jgi:dTDP-glucose pyrophosphorylase